MSKLDKSEYCIQSVSHALDLLEQFHGEIDELGVTELSKRMQLQKNNVFRLLATLESHGYIEQNKLTDSYRLGLKTLELSQSYIHQVGLMQQSRPVLESLAKHSHETCYLAILRDLSIIYLGCVESDMAVRVASRIGSRLPAYCTASGKILLAHLSDDELELYFKSQELKSYTHNTITGRAELVTQLRDILEKGFAVDNEELDIGVTCLSAPIRDYTERVIGAVSISGPSTRFGIERMQNEFIPLILEASAEISSKLGHQIKIFEFERSA